MTVSNNQRDWPPVYLTNTRKAARKKNQGSIKAVFWRMMDKDRGICDETTDPNISERNWNLNKMRHYQVETAWDSAQSFN